MMRSGSGPKVTASLAVLAGLLAAVLVVTSRGAARVSLLTRDPDAPTPSEVEYAHKMIEHQMDIHSGKKQHAGKGRLQQAFMVPQTQLEKQNIVLKKRVFGLEHEVRELSADLTAKGHHHLVKHALRHAQSSVGRAAIQAPLHTQTLHGQTKQMQWAQEALEEMKAKASKPATEAKPATKVPEPALKAMRPVRKMTTLAAAGGGGSSPWYTTLEGGTPSFTTEEGDANPVAALKPGDYRKDPYERPFLQAPFPHDPSSTLARTTTGDYASPATWGEIYRNKETIDWCTETYDFFGDRINCIAKLHPQGPLLG